jgi:hypothetical protein
MKDQEIILTTNEKIVVPSQKLSYSSPVLQVFGSVGTLTQGGASQGTDGAGRQSAKL